MDIVDNIMILDNSSKMIPYIDIINGNIKKLIDEKKSKFELNRFTLIEVNEKDWNVVYQQDIAENLNFEFRPYDEFAPNFTSCFIDSLCPIILNLKYLLKDSDSTYIYLYTDFITDNGKILNFQHFIDLCKRLNYNYKFEHGQDVRTIYTVSGINTIFTSNSAAQNSFKIGGAAMIKSPPPSGYTYSVI